MDETPPGRVDKFNQAIKGIVVLMFSGAFVYAFALSEDKVSVTEFVMALMVALNYWFGQPKKEDEKKPPTNGNGHANSPPPGTQVTPTA